MILQRSRSFMKEDWPQSRTIKECRWLKTSRPSSIWNAPPSLKLGSRKFLTKPSAPFFALLQSRRSVTAPFSSSANDFIYLQYSSEVYINFILQSTCSSTTLSTTCLRRPSLPFLLQCLDSYLLIIYLVLMPFEDSLTPRYYFICLRLFFCSAYC